jgi:DNA-binding NarL/FixJ family response regulator
VTFFGRPARAENRLRARTFAPRSGNAVAVPEQPAGHTTVTDAAGDALTDRERAIAELVVTGETNKQVGARLYLSEKTVETHLSRVYAKLGVKSRMELAATWPPD